MAVKRLMQEFKELVGNPTEGVVAGPSGEDSFFEWDAMVLGPQDTPFADGCFAARLTFPPDYPLNPPKMRFTTPLFHPNVYKNGEVCISILHPPGDDKYGYEKSSERWSPVQSVEKILMSVISMLATSARANSVRVPSPRRNCGADSARPPSPSCWRNSTCDKGGERGCEEAGVPLIMEVYGT